MRPFNAHPSCLSKPHDHCGEQVPRCYCIPSTSLHTLASHCGIVAHCNWNRIFSEIIFPRLPQPQRRLWSSSQYSTVQASRLNLWGALVCLFLRCKPQHGAYSVWLWWEYLFKFAIIHEKAHVFIMLRCHAENHTKCFCSGDLLHALTYSVREPWVRSLLVKISGIQLNLFSHYKVHHSHCWRSCPLESIWDQILASHRHAFPHYADCQHIMNTSYVTSLCQMLEYVATSSPLQSVINEKNMQVFCAILGSRIQWITCLAAHGPEQNNTTVLFVYNVADCGEQFLFSTVQRWRRQADTEAHQ